MNRRIPIASILLFIGIVSFGQTNTMIVDWGDDTFSQLRKSFRDARAVKVSAGYEHTLAILEDGTVIAWGDDTFNQLDVPNGIIDPIEVESGLGHSLVLQANGEVVGWGFNEFGQIDVGSLTNVIDIAAGDEHSVVLFENGTVQVIADGSTTYDLTPPAGLSNVVSIASGNFHILALKDDGTVVSWGANEFLQSDTPAGLSDVVSIDAGQFHSIALKNDGSIVGWGDNSLFGQLETPSGFGFGTIQVGDFHSMALSGSSDLSIWGSNRFAESEIPDVLQGRTIADSSFTTGFAHNTLVASNIAPTAIQIDDTIYVDENTPTQNIFATLETKDPDLVDDHVYELVAGQGDDDNLSFRIFMLNDKSLISDDLRWGNLFNLDGIFSEIELDYESDSLYSIRIRSTDLGGLSVEKRVIVLVQNVNEESISINLEDDTILERSPQGSMVGIFTTVDTDLFDSHTYTFSSGNGDDDNGVFTISGDRLLINEVPIHSERNSYSIRIRSTDSGGLFIEVPFIITVIPVNDPPTDVLLSNNMIEEDQPEGTLVGFFSSIDPDPEDSYSYSLVPGVGDSGNTSFRIENDALFSARSFDFLEQNSYSIRVRSTDDGLPEIAFLEKEFVINILQSNEAPLIDDQLFNVKETAENGDLVGTIIAFDEDEIAMTIASGNEFGVFSLDAVTGQLTVANNGLLDAIANPVHVLGVLVADEFGLNARATITVNVEFVALPPEIDDQFFEIAETIPNQETVGIIQAVSPKENTLAFTISSGNENGVFSLEPDGTLLIEDNSTLDARRIPQYRMTVIVEDPVQDLIDEGSILVSVTDLNLPPSDILLDNNVVDELKPEGTRI
ncbi:MAG: hypothetical protein AAF789_01875 [Bacteroidota bacterium]